MRMPNIFYVGAAMLLSALAGSLIGPRPAWAVAREIIELQRDVTALLQGQKDLSNQITQDHAIQKTLIEQSADTVGKLNGTMSSLQKSVQDVQANSGARLDTMSTQVQGLTTSKKSSLVSASSISNSWTCRTRCRALTRVYTARDPVARRAPACRLPIQAVGRWLRPVVLLPAGLPPRIRSTPTACGTSPAANTIWRAQNSRII